MSKKRVVRAIVDFTEVDEDLSQEDEARLSLLRPSGIPHEEMLIFFTGDLIEAYELVDYGWWRGRLLPDGPEGYFDQINVEVLEHNDSQPLLQSAASSSSSSSSSPPVASHMMMTPASPPPPSGPKPSLLSTFAPAATRAPLPPPKGRFGIQSILEAIDLELELLHQKWGDESSLQQLQRVRAQTMPYKAPIPPGLTAPPGTTAGAVGAGAAAERPHNVTAEAMPHRGTEAAGVGKIQINKLPKPPPIPNPKPVNLGSAFASAQSSSPPSTASPLSVVYPTNRAKTATRVPPKAQTLHAPPSKSTPPPTPPSASSKPLTSSSASAAAAAAAATFTTTSPKSRPLSPEHWKAKFQQLESKLRGDPDTQSSEEARERKNRFIARMDFLKLKKAQLTQKQQQTKMKKSRSMDSLDKLAISHIVVSQPVSIPMDWPAHNNKGKAPEGNKSPPPPPVSMKPKPQFSAPPPVPEMNRDRSKSAASRLVLVPSPPPPLPQKPLPRPPARPLPIINQTNRTSFLCEAQIEPTRPPIPPPKPKFVRRNSIEKLGH